MAEKKKGQQRGDRRDAEQVAKEKLALPLRERLMRGMCHSLRYQLLTHLNDREWSPNELSDQLAEGLSQVSYHVKVLKDYGLIELTKTVPRRGAIEHFYRASTRTIIGLNMAKEIPRSGRQMLIGGILEEVIPVLMDEEGCAKAHAIGDKYIEDILEVAGEATERLAESDDPKPIGVTAVLLVFPSALAAREKESPR
ncbi:MAG: ArsR/SmtB family transcription factor [Solirubrobacterales bacterium]